MAPTRQYTHCVISAAVLWATAFASTSTCAQAQLAATDSDEAHPGSSIEPLYAEALIHFSRAQLGLALRKLDELFAKAPDFTEGLLLQAQIFQQMGNDKEVIKTYSKLLRRSDLDSLTSNFCRFELAHAYHRQHDFGQARPLLVESIAKSFNVQGANLLLGIEDYDSGHPVEAEAELEKAAHSTEASTQVPALYYLGLTEFQLGFEQAGVRQIYQCNQAALTEPADQRPKEILTAVRGLLNKIDQDDWFGTLGFTGQFDSNAALLPTQDLASGLSTTSLNLLAGIGRKSRATDKYQWVTSLRFNGNLNFPSDTTSSYEFETLTPAVYLNVKPLSRLPWGAKIETNLTAQGQPTGFRFPFLISGDVSVYARYRPSARTELGIEGGLQPQNYVPPEVSGYSGLSYYARASAARESLRPLFNPSISFETAFTSTSDSSNSFTRISLHPSNVMKLKSMGQISTGLDLALYSYGALGRTDQSIAPRIEWLYPYSQRLSLLFHLAYYSNSSSNPQAFSYSRLVTGAGLNLAF